MSNDIYDRIRFRGNPVADAKSIVVSENVRFTFLTERMVRLEWSPDGDFEDRGTYAFPTRYTGYIPDISVNQDADTITAQTTGLKITYLRHSGAFCEDNLSVEYRINDRIRTWRPGAKDSGNLRGTRRTLDQCEGAAPLDIGLISRDGWVLFDDSKNVVFDETGWVTSRPEYRIQDWYFLGYGHDYKTALADYARFSGTTPLIPYFVLGGWWSRYWAYSEQDFKDLVAEFEENGIPLDVFVIDMDWHTPLGWTGYTWNTELFPDPPAFLKWLHTKGLKTTLNLHPADGVHSHEKVYPAFARAMHMDPESEQPVPFKIADKQYVKHYFEMIHHPMENDGVDFWWMDWQQGEISEVRGLDPLPWINHLHFNDIKRRGIRPMLYSRWGGLGNHRYYIGFSGDTYVTWEALQFQPYMTSTAANVMYGWWSHDIGGHMGGATDPELYARWVQFGALSPVLRLHSTKDPRAERRPWAYPSEIFQAAKSAFLFRYQLIPYLYTMARLASETSIALCRPMYYEYPDEESTYYARYQYYLGSELIAAPIVFPRKAVNNMATQDAWIPPGTWYAYDTLESHTGPRWITLAGDINKMPLFARAGAIVPLAPPFTNIEEPLLQSGTTSAMKKDHLDLVIFPGEGQFDYYEDDGETESYQQNAFMWTCFTTSQPDEQTWLVTIHSARGQYVGVSDQKRYALHLKGSCKPTVILVNGNLYLDWQYSSDEITTLISLPPVSIGEQIIVQVKAGKPIIAIDDAYNKQMIAKDIRSLLGEYCPSDPFDIHTVNALNTTVKNEILARLGAPFVSGISYSTREDIEQNLGTLIIASSADGTEYSVHVDLDIHHEGIISSYKTEYIQTTKSHILNIPVRNLKPVTQMWEAYVQFDWQNETWEKTYKCKPLFPGVTTWQCTACDRSDTSEVMEIMFADGDNERNSDLSWKLSQPDLKADITFTRCHVVPLKLMYAEELAKTGDLSVLLTSLVNSIEERDVIIEFTSNTQVEIYLNGQLLREQDFIDSTALGRFVTGTHFSQLTRLKQGNNILVVNCPAERSTIARWFFGCVITAADGDLLLDLTYA